MKSVCTDWNETASGAEGVSSVTNTHDPLGGAVCLRPISQGWKSRARLITVLVEEVMCITYLLLFLKEYFTERCEFCYYLVTLLSFKGTVHPKITILQSCHSQPVCKPWTQKKRLSAPIDFHYILATQWKSMGTKTLLPSFVFHRRKKVKQVWKFIFKWIMLLKPACYIFLFFSDEHKRGLFEECSRSSYIHVYSPKNPWSIHMTHA